MKSLAITTRIYLYLNVANYELDKTVILFKWCDYMLILRILDTYIKSYLKKENGEEDDFVHPAPRFDKSQLEAELKRKREEVCTILNICLEMHTYKYVIFFTFSFSC